MSKLVALKKKAADLERKSPDKAVPVYAEILALMERDPTELDVALYNRVGDILVKYNRIGEAVDYYEKAVDHYVDGGFFNNAIALCNKILRSSPARSSVYYKLGKINAHKGFKADAKTNFLEYADRMQKVGQVNEAFRALAEFADLCPDQTDIRLMLAEQLAKANKTADAVEQLQILHEQLHAEGRGSEAEAAATRMKALDPSVEPRTGGGGSKSGGDGDLIFLDLSDSPQAAAARRSIATKRVSTMGNRAVGTPPAAPRAYTPPPPSPARPVAAAPPPPPEPEPELEPELEQEPEPPPPPPPPPPRQSIIAPEPVLEAREVPPEMPPVSSSLDESGAGLLDFSSSSFGDTSTPSPFDSSLDIQPTSLGEVESPMTAGDFDMVLSGAGDPVAGAAAEAVPNIPLLDGTLDFSPPAEPVAEVPLEQADLDDLARATAARSSTAINAKSVKALQKAVDANPEDWAAHRELAEALLETGDREGGVRELETAMLGYERSEDLTTAMSVADEIVRLEPSSVKHHQKRVEYSYRTNDRGQLVESYLALADALFRTGQVDKSRSIYQRVLELSPDDVRAQAALSTMPEPEPPPVPEKKTAAKAKTPPAPKTPAPIESVRPTPLGDDAFVNLGDMLRDSDSPKDLRMVVAEEEPTGNEEADFADMLKKFKQGIAENVEAEDYQSHYDLGVAYKEMGLVDEAIAEFQKALRGPTNRVRTYESIGQCFIEKNQNQMAATILARALSEKDIADEQLVGVLYLLGRANEALGRIEEALQFYQRVFIVDIGFHDVADRLNALENAAR